MDGTWHSDSKLKAVMTASGKDRFSVKSSSGNSRPRMSKELETNYNKCRFGPNIATNAWL